MQVHGVYQKMNDLARSLNHSSPDDNLLSAQFLHTAVQAFSDAEIILARVSQEVGFQPDDRTEGDRHGDYVIKVVDNFAPFEPEVVQAWANLNQTDWPA